MISFIFIDLYVFVSFFLLEWDVMVALFFSLAFPIYFLKVYFCIVPGFGSGEAASH
jgi:hypothetical protein